MLAACALSPCMAVAAEKEVPQPPKVVLPQSVQSIRAQELGLAISEGKFGTIIDIRTPDETRRTSMLPKATPIDYFASNFLEMVEHANVDRSRPCLIYCALGGRARRSAVLLAARGHTNIVVLEDGYDAWMKVTK